MVFCSMSAAPLLGHCHSAGKKQSGFFLSALKGDLLGLLRYVFSLGENKKLIDTVVVVELVVEQEGYWGLWGREEHALVMMW